MVGSPRALFFSLGVFHKHVPASHAAFSFLQAGVRLDLQRGDIVLTRVCISGCAAARVWLRRAPESRANLPTRAARPWGR